MSDQMSLEDVLSGEAVVEPETKEEVTEEAQPETVETPDEAVPETPEESTEEPTGVTDEPPSSTKEVPLAAMLDERDKRKALQVELDKLRAEQEKAKTEKVDFWENPEAAISSIKEELRNEYKSDFTNGLLAFSMQSASYRHQDYDAMREAFTQAAEQNPSLVDQALQSVDPGEYIYNTGRQFSQLDAVGGDIDAMRERMRAELKAELLQEMSGKEEKLKAVPTPITDETSAANPRDTVEGGPTPLENILKR